MIRELQEAQLSVGGGIWSAESSTAGSQVTVVFDAWGNSVLLLDHVTLYEDATSTEALKLVTGSSPSSLRPWENSPGGRLDRPRAQQRNQSRLGGDPGWDRGKGKVSRFDLTFFLSR